MTQQEWKTCPNLLTFLPRLNVCPPYYNWFLERITKWLGKPDYGLCHTTWTPYTYWVMPPDWSLLPHPSSTKTSCNGPVSHYEFQMPSDGVQPKMSPSISFSGMYQKLFILSRNRTNSWYRALMYFLTCFFCLYFRSKTGIITIRLILDIHLFSNVVTMSFDYDFFRVLVQKLK